MPLLKKKEFHLSNSRDGFSDSEKVFHCLATNEIFRSYDEFCARVILCNSMVWSCKYTGKSSLTYAEAVESEANAKNLFKNFPSDLRLPILFISTKTKRTSFHDMVEDVYGYTKDRYFIGENVDASFTDNKWHLSHLLQVIPPSPEKLKKSTRNGQDHYGPPPTLYHYEVEQMDSGDPELSEVMIVNHEQIRRKNQLTRDKIKLFLKQYVEQNELGVFIIQPSVLQKFGIHKMRFDQIFDGSIPNFQSSKKLTKGGKNVKQASMVSFLTHTKNESKNVSHTKNESKNKSNAKSLSPNPVALMEKMRKQREDFERQKEELKQKKAEERIRQQQEKYRVLQMLREWRKPKYDLELVDHKMLPVATPVSTQIPDEYIGAALSLIEFTNSFSKFLNVDNFFPGGLTFEAVERAIVEKEVAGPLMDLFQMFLSALFTLQIEENSQCNTNADVVSVKKGLKYSTDMSLTDATHFATLALNWSTKYQGIPLNQLSLYSLTTSEILRLHLLSSGACVFDTGSKWRYQYRGGYLSEDDPGLYFRLKCPHILSALALHCVTELPTGDILKILDCLMSQLLTYSDVRDQIEDELEKSRQAKDDYRSAQISERKHEQEFITARSKIKKESKENKEGSTEEGEKLVKDYEIKKAEIGKTLSKFSALANQHQIHLGQDRAFRKYLKMKSLPGLFINFEEDHPGYCYTECIPLHPELANAADTQIIAHLHKVQEETNTSDKENTLSQNNIVDGEVSSNTSFIDQNKLLTCNSNPKTCIVHSSAVPRQKWSYYNTPEQVTELVDSLNSRGINERELKQTIACEQNYYMDLVQKTPVILNSMENDSEQASKYSKRSTLKYDDATLGYPKELSTSLILQYVLVENILELEEKIFVGNLGSLKVKDRNAWRKSLASHHYDVLDITLKKIIKIKDSDRGSRPGTPDITKDYEDSGKLLGLITEMQYLDNDTDNCEKSSLSHSEEHKLAIQTLAYALAQVAEGVDSRCLKKPLGNARTRSDSSKGVDKLDKWESSLLVSTSYCQIFLHYSSLDNCILWTRSAFQARCIVCRKKRDTETSLLCNRCNRGQHLHCCRPKLKSVPEGEWYCSKCKAQIAAEEKLKNPTPRLTRRRVFVEEEEEESSDNNSQHNNKKRKRLEESSDDSEQQNIKKKKKFVGRKLRSSKSRKKRVVVTVSSESSESDSKVSDAEEEKDNDEPENTEEEESDKNEPEPIKSEEENDKDESVKSEEEADNDEEKDNEDSEAEGNAFSDSEIREEDVTETLEADEADKEDTEQLTSKVNGMPNGDIANEAVNGDGPVEVCEKCWLEGTLLCCDNCPDLYHLECANPPLRRVPRGEWLCHKCKSSKKKEDTADDDWYQSHSVAQRSGFTQNQRRCAARSRNTINGFTQMVRRISKCEDNSRRSIRRDDLPLNNVLLQEVVGEVMKQEFAWPFLRPVNKNEVPDYYDIVQNPMDFGTIKYKLNMGDYKFDSDLMADVRLVFENCNLYNNSNDEVYQCGLKMLDYFVEKCRELGLHLPHDLEYKEVLSETDPLSTESPVEKMEVL